MTDHPSYDDLPEQARVRREKLDRLRAAGVDPYPVGFPRTVSIGGLRERYRSLPADTGTGERVGVVGRVMLSRTSGKLCFATIRDGTGDLQVMVSLDRIGAEHLAAWKHDVDLGDHIGVEGEVITSRRGELSVLAERYAIISKGLRPLPEKHRGLADLEARVRQRYVDLIVNPESRRMLEIRSASVRALRDSMEGRGFLEVETPMLQAIHGGANARPFATHINAYDMPLYLRIAVELYLKRLVVGGVERVFEIGRDFRNEGVDSSHNPEFTMLECYQAYADYDVMQTLTRELIQEAARKAYGSTVVRHADGTEHDLGGQWRTRPVHEAVGDALGEEVTPDTPAERLRELSAKADVPLDPSWGRGDVLLEMYERLVEERTVEPTFYRDFPTEVSPLTRQHRKDPRLAERWDLVAFGAEIGTAYSELVDPVEQRRRLTEQSLRAAGGDAEAMQLDEDFLRALEYGMPPTGGMGMGVERMLMMFTGANIRETILFPLVRPE
ncbi:MAG: bifunctional lysylphosphatidylglycerol synthetase/lysine--tRNA ligase LysX [Streptosporangiaceae bacterium]